MNNDDDPVHLTIRIPESYRRQLKKRAVDEGLSVQSLVINALNQCYFDK